MLQTFALLCAIHTAPNIQLKKTFYLDLLPDHSPIFHVAPDGYIWGGHYRTGDIHQMTPDGKTVMVIGKSSMHGPLPIDKLVGILAFPKSKTLVTYSSLGFGISFDIESGQLKKQLFNNLSGFMMNPLGDEKFQISKHIPTSNGDNFSVYNLKGEKVTEWLWDINKDQETKIKAGMHAQALSDDGTFYYCEGAFPTVSIYKQKFAKPKLWHLKHPKYYQEPPSKPINPTLRFNILKREEWYNSFTQVRKIHLIEDKYLVVTWFTHDPTPHLITVFDIKTRSPVLENLDLGGYVIGIKQKDVYVLTLEAQSEDVYAEEKYKMSVYTFTPPGKGS